MYIPAQNSDVSVSNYFETVLCPNCLIPKASLALPPTSYLPCSLAAPLLLIMNLSLQGRCFGKHPPTTSGRCCGATQGIGKRSPQSRSPRQNMTSQRQHVEDAHTRITELYQITLSGCCTEVLKSYPLSCTNGKQKKIYSLTRASYSRGHSMLDAICSKLIS